MKTEGLRAGPLRMGHAETFKFAPDTTFGKKIHSGRTC
jgi:hypothetical protein